MTVAATADPAKCTRARSQIFQKLPEPSMTLKFATTVDTPESAVTPCIVVGLYEGHELTRAAARIDEKSGGAIKRLIDGGDATGKPGSSTLLFGVANIAA